MSADFYINCTLMLSSLIFLIFLVAIYFTKKNMQNIENKIYRQLLIWNFIVIMLYIIAGLLLMLYFNNIIYFNNYIIGILAKVCYSSVLAWFSIFICYIIVVSNEKNDKFILRLNRNRKKFFLILSIIIIFIWLIQILLPATAVVVNNTGAILSGLAATFWSVCLVLFFIIGFFTIIINIKKINKKKISPFIVVSILGVIFVTLSFIFPLNLICLLITLISYLMYHTIENPDLKIINELELARNQAEKSNNAKTEFLSSMSHELKTPLNAIVGLSESIKLSNNVEEMHEDSEDILKSSQNLLEMVNGILDISRIEANKVEIVEGEYNPIEIFNGIVKLINARIGEKEIELRTNFSSNIPNKLYGDREKIKQIISNILTNAVKYTERVT